MSEGPKVYISVGCSTCSHKHVVPYKFNDEHCYRAECTKMQVVLSLKLKHIDDSPNTPAYCPYVSTALRLAMTEQKGQEK